MEGTVDLPAGIPRIGEIFAEKYRIERVLGVGGMGVVLAAHHIHLEETVAIKLLLPAVAANPEFVGRFLREGRAAIKIRSEHVGRVIDVGKPTTGAPYLVMEYLEGIDLATMLDQRGPLPIAMAADYLLQAGEALAEAHAMGTIHRDLKPANLFVTTRADGSVCVKVLDFGISKVADGATSGDHSMTKSTTLLGSPLYMSPEQLRSLRSVDARTDIWALGVILFEMLSGAPPFQGQTLPDLSVSIITTSPPPLRALRPDAPAGIDEFIAHCLQKDVAKRVANMAEFARGLAPFGSAAAHASAEAISRVLVSTSGPRPAVRDSFASGSNPAISNPAVARTEVAWDTQSIPMKKKGPAVLVGGMALVAALGIGFAAARGARIVDPPRPLVHDVDAGVTATTASTPTATPSDIELPPVAPSGDTVHAVQEGDAGPARIDPPDTHKRHPKLPASARPPVPPSSSVPPRLMTPNGVTLDRHG